MSPSETTPLPIDPITCHVLDQTTGRPASSLHVTLTLLHPSFSFKPRFRSTTTPDGRITSWTPFLSDQEGHSSLATVLKYLNQEGKEDDEPTLWSLRFETERYFGKGKSFYPEVEVKFFVDWSVLREGEERSHVHVPLLLAPWGYTTYRGS